MTCDRFDVVAVPFPFSERRGAKKRPAVVLSNRSFNAAGHSVMAMITTQSHPAWPGDVALSAAQAAGLRMRCLARLKLFTLDNRLILKRIGRLAPTDAGTLAGEQSRYLA